jgi:hypothetical protein
MRYEASRFKRVSCGDQIEYIAADHHSGARSSSSLHGYELHVNPPRSFPVVCCESAFNQILYVVLARRES